MSCWQLYDFVDINSSAYSLNAYSHLRSSLHSTIYTLSNKQFQQPKERKEVMSINTEITTHTRTINIYSIWRIFAKTVVFGIKAHDHVKLLLIVLVESSLNMGNTPGYSIFEIQYSKVKIIK
eukprot:630430_1